MQEPNIYEILSLLYQRFESFQTLWTIYNSVVFGILAALISFPKYLDSKLTRIILIIGFFFFSFANLGALIDVQKDRLYILNELKSNYNCKNCNPYKGLSIIGRFEDDFREMEIEPSSNYIESMICDKEINAFKPIKAFHYFQDLLVILLIWILPRTLIGLKPFKSLSETTVSIKGSKLPDPKISWNQLSRIWILEEKVNVDISSRELSKVIGIEIPKGFKFDLSTIPRFLWSFIAPFELSIIAPLVHDFLYVNKGNLKVNEQNMLVVSKDSQTVKVSRLEADSIFLYHMKQEGVGFVKRWIAYIGVRLFGGIFWKG